MSESKSIQNVSTALARIEEGIKAVRESSRYAEYLAFCSRFHHYSLGNQILIWRIVRIQQRLAEAAWP